MKMHRVPGLEDLDVHAWEEVARCAVVGAATGGVRRTSTVGAVEPTARFRIASLTKPFTAVAAVQAADEAGVALGAAVLDVLPELAADWTADRGITIAHLLSQTSGLAPTVTAQDVADLGDDDAVLVEAARLVARAGSARPPGQAWEYYNGNYFLAGAVIAALTGGTYERAVQTLVLDPWGLATTSFSAPPDLVAGWDQGQPVARTAYPRGRRPSGGLCSTVPDLLTFGERLLDSPSLLGRLRTVHTPDADPVRYGLGWAIGPSGQMYLNGRLPGLRAALLLEPGTGLVGAALAAGSESLPAVARVLSDLQRSGTGDDLSRAIDTFAE